MKESNMTKAVCKALTWRIVGTAEVFVISWFTTGTLELAGHIAGFAAVTSTVLYVIHEKVWHHLSARALRPIARSIGSVRQFRHIEPWSRT
jgi:uncharacterized membrane protein